MFVIKVVFKDLDREGNHVYRAFEYEDGKKANDEFNGILYDLNNLKHMSIDYADNLRYIYASDTVHSVVLYEKV